MKLASLAGLAAPCLLAACPTRSPDELRVVYTPGLKVVFELSEWRTEHSALTFEELEEIKELRELPELLSAASMRAEDESQVIRFTTWFDTVEAGRPVQARRRFNELHRRGEKRDDQGQVTGEANEEGPLAGRTVLLTAGAARGEVAARLHESDGGPDVDPAYLKNHRLAFEVERVLPGRAVEVGETWQLPDATAREILDASPTIYFESEAAAFGQKEEQVRALLEGVEISGSITYERREEIAGEACAVLLIALRAERSESDLQALLGKEEPGGGQAFLGSYSATLEARLWLALERGRPVRGEGTFAATKEVRTESPDDSALDFTAIGRVRSGFRQSWTYDEER